MLILLYRISDGAQAGWVLKGLKMSNGPVDLCRVMCFSQPFTAWAQGINGSQDRGKKDRGKTAPDRKAPEKAQKRA